VSRRVALVGLGRWGTRLLPELAARFEVATCCTTGGETGRAWLAARFPALPLAPSVEDVLGDETVDVVVLATPIDSHRELTERALRAGKHVFVEKPLATSAADAAELAELARARGRVLFVGHVYLYHPVLESLLAATADDPVVQARLTWRKLGSFDSDIFWNLLSHEVSLALALLRAAPDEVAVLATTQGPTACDAALVELRFPGGGTALIDVDRMAPARSKAVAIATAGGRRLVWQDDALFELRDGELVRSAVAEGSALGRELDAFRAALERGEPFPSDGAHAAAVVAALTRIRRAAGYGSDR
jgi:predicted dehydrogenase